jgi:hypothetical protein
MQRPASFPTAVNEKLLPTLGIDAGGSTRKQLPFLDATTICFTALNG